MRLLQRNFDVTTRYGGGFVQEIDGRRGRRAQDGRRGRLVLLRQRHRGRRRARRRASSSPGDRVWWDHHDWGAAMRVPAVVGSFPEPFAVRRGAASKLPVRLVCARRRGARVRRGRRRGSSDAGVDGRRAPDRRRRRRAGGAAAARRALDARSARDPAAAQLEQGPEGLGRVRAADADGERDRRCSTRDGKTVRDARRGRRASSPRRASRTSSRPGSSPAPTTSASPRRPPRCARTQLRDHFAVAIEDGPRGPAAAAAERRRRRDLPAPRQPAARRARRRRRRCAAWRSAGVALSFEHPLILLRAAGRGAARGGAARGRRARGGALAAVGAAVRAA